MTRTAVTGHITRSTPLGGGACKPRKRRIAVDEVLAEVVQRLLAKRWSPEQVAHELRVLFAGQP